jgi:hypothetical protein
VDLTAMGRVGLTGWRGRVAQRVAPSISERSKLTPEQVEALIGAIFLALTIWQFIKLLRRVWTAGQGEELGSG